MKKWHTRPAADKIWQDFKDYFEDKCTSLRKVRVAMMRSTAFYQTSLLAAQVLNEVKDIKTSVQESLLLLVDETDHDGAYEENRANFAANPANSNYEILKLLKNCRKR